MKASAPILLRRLLVGPKERYLVAGCAIFAFNLLVAWSLFQITVFAAGAWGRNAANFVAVELTTLFAFLLHSTFTWKSPLVPDLWRKLWRFHAVTGFGLLLRIVLFGALDSIGVHWLAATVLSILVIVVLNYFGYERAVFDQGRAR